MSPGGVIDPDIFRETGAGRVRTAARNAELCRRASDQPRRTLAAGSVAQVGVCGVWGQATRPGLPASAPVVRAADAPRRLRGNARRRGPIGTRPHCVRCATWTALSNMALSAAVISAGVLAVKKKPGEAQLCRGRQGRTERVDLVVLIGDHARLIRERDDVVRNVEDRDRRSGVLQGRAQRRIDLRGRRAVEVAVGVALKQTLRL